MTHPCRIRDADKAIPPKKPGQGLASLSARTQLYDRTIRGVHPTDALEDQVRQEWCDRRAQRDPYLSQEFVASVNTGRDLDPEKWRERRARDDRLQQQTELLATALERTGESVRRNAEVMSIGLITGAQELLNAYRSICFFPTVAQRDRRPMLNELLMFRRTHRNHGKFMRYAVITAGRPIPLGGLPLAKQSSSLLERREYFALRNRIGELSRSVSRFAQWALEVHDIDVVFRGIEFTVKQRDGDNFLSAHPHANVLYTPLKLLSEADWAAFLVGADRFFEPWWWRDCGRLKDPREAIKYPFKPVELDPQRIGDAGVRWLFEQTFGLPMMQPLGSFRHWRKDVFWIVDIDVGGKSRPRKHRRVVNTEYPAGARLEICSVRKRIGKPRNSHKLVGKDQEPRENRLLGFTMPQRRFSPYAEPIVKVMNYTPQPVTGYGQEALDGIDAERRRVRPVWDMNGAPDPDVALAVGRGQAAAREGDAGDVVPFSVHTSRTTAGTRSCRDPPIPIRATAADPWQQLGVDFSVGLSDGCIRR